MGWGPQDPYAGGGIDPQAQQFMNQNQQIAQSDAAQGYQVGHHKGPLTASGANNYKQFVPADTPAGATNNPSNTMSSPEGPSQGTVGDFNNQSFGVSGQSGAAVTGGNAVAADTAASGAGMAAAGDESIAALF